MVKDIYYKNYLAILSLSIIFCKNLGVIVLVDLLWFILPGGPFILKLIPNNPSPTSFGIIISPKTGILKSFYLRFAGTKVPFRLVTFAS